MKKLLVLMLVLGFAASANAFIADTISIRVAVNPSSTYVESEWVDPGTDAITMNPSDNLWVGVYNSTAGSGGGELSQKGYVQLGIICPDGETHADTGWTSQGMLYKPPLCADAAGPEGSAVNQYAGIVDYNLDESLWLDYWDMYVGAPSTTNNGVGILDSVQIHRDGANFVVDEIRLINADTGELLDTILVQTPEPMTLMLLGLGGLFLRRRN